MKSYFPDPRTVLSAALLYFAAPPWNFYFLVWVALIPWLWALSIRKSLREGFIQGLWLAVLFGAVICYWVVTSAHSVRHTSYAVAIPAGVFFWCWMQPQFLVFPLFFVKRVKAKALLWQAVLGLSFFYVALDAYLPRILSTGMAVSLYHAENLRQVVDLGGIPLLTFLIFFTNLAFLYALQARFRLQKSIPAIIAMALCLCATLYGYFRRSEIHGLVLRSQAHTRGIVVQAFSLQSDILKHYLELSNAALDRAPNTDFVLWPEFSFGGLYRASTDPKAKERDQMIEKLVQSRKVSLVFGDRELDRREQKVFNALSILDPTARLQFYKKSLLMPFAETMPGDEILPGWWRKHRPGRPGKSAGPGPAVLKLMTSSGPILVNPIICFEGTVPDYSLEGARLGSSLILNMSGDGEFLNTNEPELHLTTAAFSSIESRLPQIRATDSGISALILPDGEIVNPTPQGQELMASYDIPITGPIASWVSRWGSWFQRFSILGSVLAFI